MGKIHYLGSVITTQPLDAEEQKMFDEQYNSALVTVDSDERRILQDRKGNVLSFVEAMKDHFKTAFGGYQAGDTEVGFTFIRPGHVGFTTTRTWKITIAASDAFQDWIGTSGAKVTTGGSSGQAGLIAFYLKSYAADPKVSEVLVKAVGRKEFMPSVVRSIKLGDNTNQVPIIPMPTIMALPKSDLYLRLKGDTVGAEEVELGGFMVGLGRYLKEETY